MPDVAPSLALPPGFARTMIVVTTLMMSLMAAVDLTIVTVALPYMSGSLGATADDITWVVTMYTVAQAVAVGISGHLSRLLGRKQLCIISVTGFVAASMACGLSQTLNQIILFRFIQGFFSGPLIPIAQSIIIDTYPPAERTKGISLWVLGVMVGPALGPALGGWLAENLDWRWNFWVNLPVGVAALLLVLRYVRPVAAQAVKTDWLGLALVFLFVTGFQIVLDRGDIDDWFGSHQLVYLAILAAATGTAFVWRGWTLGSANIINLTLLRDRNFTICSLIITILAIVFLGLLVLTPEVFIDFFGWEVSSAGLVIGSYGIAGLFGSIVGGRLVARAGIRTAIVLSGVLMAYGWWKFSRLDLNAGLGQCMIPGMWIQFGLLLIYGPLASQAFKNLRPEQRDEGAGLFNFVKTLGFSLGVTLVGTLMYRGIQANWTRYGGDLSLANPGLRPWLDSQGYATVTPQAGAELSQVLLNQVQMLTFVQTAEILCVVSLACTFLGLLLPRNRLAPALLTPSAPAIPDIA
jgi:MFS transporter, DHA2 family, multidrug resistance protein